MKTTISKLNSTVVRSIEIKKINISKKHCVFSADIKIENNFNVLMNNKELTGEPEFNEENFQGLCTIKDYNNFLKKGLIPRSLHIEIFSEEQFELLSQFGYRVTHSDFLVYSYDTFAKKRKIFEANKIFMSHNIDVKNKIFDIISEKPELIESIVLNDFSNNQFYFISTGKIVPLGVYIDYIDANVHNAKYNLNEVVNILKERGDVYFVTDQYSNTIIKDIPYYNADRNRSSFIECFIKISSEEAELINLERQKHKYPYATSSLHQVIWDNDLFGIKKAALCDKNFYSTIEKEDDSEETYF